MYKCSGCGETFTEPSYIRETHGFADGHFEELAVCPECGSLDFELVSDCKLCGQALTGSAPICEKCLREEFTLLLCANYLRENKLVSEFVFKTLLKVSAMEQSQYANELAQMLFDKFLDDAVADEKMQETLQNFILADAGECGRIEAAEWLIERGC